MSTIIPYDYNPLTGVFVWNTGARKGKLAGYAYSNGYYYLRFNNRVIGAHRIAWLCIHGVLPKQIDHINGNPSDNRIENLRPSNQSQNKQNARVKKTAPRGLKGICYCRDHKKWRAMIGPRGAVKHLGYFNTPELAHAAYVDAAKNMYGEFARV